MNAQDEALVVDEIVSAARAAQRAYEAQATQERYDLAAQAAGWAIMEPDRNRSLAELAVQTTGLGNVPDKILKNHRKTLGLMRDIAGVRTCGVVSDDPETGITEIIRPIGVVGAVVPSTNPAATPANNIVNALKGGDAIVLAPSPKGVATCSLLLRYVHAELVRIGADRNLVQMLPPPGSKAKTQRLMELVDLIVATGSRDNVRRAYSSGTPAIGVGAGNVAVIVDETADLAAAARKIAASKTFDNATSCSSENAVVVVEEIYDAFTAELAMCGGAIVRNDQEIVSRLWLDGRLNPLVVARDAAAAIAALGLDGKVPEGARFLAVETAGVGDDYPLSGEKLSLVLGMYRAKDFDDAAAIATRILSHQGAGHSVGIHTARDGRAIALGRTLPACRVIVNQAHAFATGGSFTNGMPFSLSMGCGSWGGNSIDQNLHWRHFVQTARIVREIPSKEPSLEDIFREYWVAARR